MIPFHAKHLSVLLLVLAGATASAPETPSNGLLASGGSDDPRDLLAESKIDARQAIAIAMKHQPGHAVEVELESEVEKQKRIVFWAVDVICDAGIMEFEIAADDGRVLEKEIYDDRRELKAYREALRHSELDLVSLIAKAEAYVKGRVVEGELEMDDGAPVAELVFANGRCLIEVEIEARAGHLVELELKSPGAGDEDGDEDEDHEEGEDEGEHEEQGEHHDEEEEKEGHGKDRD